MLDYTNVQHTLPSVSNNPNNHTTIPSDIYITRKLDAWQKVVFATLDLKKAELQKIHFTPEELLTILQKLNILCAAPHSLIESYMFSTAQNNHLASYGFEEDLLQTGNITPLNHPVFPVLQLNALKQMFFGMLDMEKAESRTDNLSPEQVIKVCQVFHSLYPLRLPTPYRLMAEAYKKKGDFDKQIFSLSLAAQTTLYVSPLLINLCNFYLINGNTHKATLIRKDINNALFKCNDYCLLISKFYLAKGNYYQAELYLKVTLNLSPYNYLAHVKLSNLCTSFTNSHASNIPTYMHSTGLVNSGLNILNINIDPNYKSIFLIPHVANGQECHNPPIYPADTFSHRETHSRTNAAENNPNKVRKPLAFKKSRIDSAQQLSEQNIIGTNTLKVSANSAFYQPLSR